MKKRVGTFKGKALVEWTPTEEINPPTVANHELVIMETEETIKVGKINCKIYKIFEPYVDLGEGAGTPPSQGPN